MALILEPTTELEAINVMLTNIGESPVTTLDDSDVVDAGIARTILKSINREVQTAGFWFNTDIDRKFQPTTDNRIQLPVNTLRVDTSGTDRYSKNFVQRGRFLWDRENHTYDIEEEVILTVVVGLDFDELPESARRYITVRAARIFQERMLGTPTISQFNQQDELMARAQFLSEDLEAADNNMLTDSNSTQSILGRHFFTMR